MVETRRAIVLGAGLQGACVALALRRLGVAVELVDRAARPLQGASLRNEGKVHLGLVYANDPPERTAALMLDGATSFARLLDRWCGRPLDWPALRSTPFTYAVLPETIVPPERLREHYAAVEALYRDRAEGGYLGGWPLRLVEEVPADALRGQVDGPVLAAFRTAELAVDTAGLCEAVASSLGPAGVEGRWAHEVVEVARTPAGFAVTCRTPDGTWRGEADVVVNCLWDGRLAMDRQLGIEPLRPWVHRLKYRVLGTLPDAPALPSLTFVLGPFGDVVVRPGGEVYVSWYPTCLAGWSDEVEPPGAWRAAMDGAVPDRDAEAMARAALDGIGRVVPALRDLRVHTVDAGVIVSWGSEDIDVPTSELHQRHAVGVHAHDGWFSVDTGKLTTAPLFAERLAAQL